MVRVLSHRPAGRWLATAGAEPGARLWALPEEKLIQSFTPANPITAMSFSSDEQLLLLASGNILDPQSHVLELWDLTTGKMRWNAS